MLRINERSFGVKVIPHGNILVQNNHKEPVMEIRKHLVVLELPIELEIDDIKDAIEESLAYIIKEIERPDKLIWRVANPADS